jgi:hypothetical protein
MTWGDTTHTVYLCDGSAYGSRRQDRVADAAANC